MSKPLITLGSPNGIGYEILLLSYVNSDIFKKNKIYCIGSESVLKYFINLLNIEPSYNVVKYNDIKKINFDFTEDFLLIDVDEIGFEISDIKTIDNKLDGQIAYCSVLYGAKLIEEDFFTSMVTLPVSKENINIVDKSFKGHTEFLMEVWKEDQVFMTFISDKLNVFLMSTHIPLGEVTAYINKDVVNKSLEYSIKLAEKLDNNKPICLLGLNPHAGENGLLGSEELWIKDLLDEARSRTDVIIDGPVPADTAFTPWNLEKYGLHIAFYHDQGLIPFKMLAFDSGVNLSFGMKYIRTSVDHGTARDLIGTKKAGIESFLNAYNLALKLEN